MDINTRIDNIVAELRELRLQLNTATDANREFIQEEIRNATTIRIELYTHLPNPNASPPAGKS